MTKPEFKFKIVTGHRYLGGFVGETDALHEWLDEKIKKWKHAVDQLTHAAKSVPQAAYAAMQKSLQAKWQLGSKS